MQGVPEVAHHVNLIIHFYVLDMGEKLTIQERVKLVFMFVKDEATYRSVAEEFNSRLLILSEKSH